MPSSHVYVAALETTASQLCDLFLFASEGVAQDNRTKSVKTAGRLASMDYIIVDRFHASGHTGQFCSQQCLPTAADNETLLGNFPTGIRQVNKYEMRSFNPRQKVCKSFLLEVGGLETQKRRF